MARQPFFGRGPAPQIARMDMQAATAPGRNWGAAFEGIGQDIGGAIEKYGLNEEKRNKLSAQLKGRLHGPRGAALVQSLTSSGNEESDKGNQTLIEKVLSGDAKIAELERLSGITSTLVEEDAAVAKQNAAQMDGILKQYEGRIKGLEGDSLEREKKFAERNVVNRQHVENMKTYSLERADSMGELELALRKAKDPLVIKELNQKIEAGRLENEKLEQSKLFDKDTYVARRDTILHEEKQAEADMWASVRGLEASDPDAADRKDAADQIKEAENKGVKLSFKKNPNGPGLVITSMTGDIESLGTPIPNHPGFFAYGGAVYDTNGKTPKKVGTQDIAADTKLRIDVLDALTDSAAATYLEHKQLGKEENGYYILTDVDDEELSRVKISPEMNKITDRIMELRKGIGGVGLPGPSGNQGLLGSPGMGADPLGLR